jgi:hypothetical protein
VADGRTSWYSEDAAYVDRERVVALGEELGMAVLAVMFVLRGQAKLQNDGGWVVSGVSTITRKGFIDDRDLTRRVIVRAAEVGELDDLEWLEDLRFRCRISGWSADQERAATAKRVAKHRAGNGVKRPVTVCNEDRTGQDNEDSLRSLSRNDDHDGHDAGEAAPDEAPLCHLLADLIVANGSRRPRIGKRWITAERLLLDRDKRDRSEAERLIRWCQADEFWRAHIESMAKFREKYDQLRLRAKRTTTGRQERQERDAQVLQSLIAGGSA